MTVRFQHFQHKDIGIIPKWLCSPMGYSSHLFCLSHLQYYSHDGTLLLTAGMLTFGVIPAQKLALSLFFFTTPMGLKLTLYLHHKSNILLEGNGALKKKEKEKRRIQSIQFLKYKSLSVVFITIRVNVCKVITVNWFCYQQRMNSSVQSFITT